MPTDYCRKGSIPDLNHNPWLLSATDSIGRCNIHRLREQEVCCIDRLKRQPEADLSNRLSQINLTQQLALPWLQYLAQIDRCFFAA
jgi:hypothetical protein